jgi:RNA polymerase sigma factor (sigma-70 family)
VSAPGASAALAAVSSTCLHQPSESDAQADAGSVTWLRAPDEEAAFADVLRAAYDGAPWACRRLYESLAGRVCGYFRAQAAPEPEDLTSEVFLRVFDRLPQFSGDEAQFRSWVFTIAHHLLIDDSRRRKRRPRTTDLSTHGEALPAGNVEHEAMANVGADWATSVIAALPHDQRAVVMLRVAADLPIAEVARILGKRTGAVKALQHRAVTALRRQFPELPEVTL